MVHGRSLPKFRPTRMTDMLSSFSAPWVVVLAASASDATNSLWAFSEASNFDVRFVRGRKIESETSLIDEFAAALQFPYYFGGNWNAFDECLADLSWIRSKGHVVCVLDADQMMLNDDEAFAVTLELFARVAREWCQPTDFRPAKPFHVVLHSAPSEALRLRERVAGTGVLFGDLQVPL